MKKTLSLILALALMLGALGCAGVSAETAVEYPETVSVFTGLNEHLSKLGVTNYNETYYWQELEKRTGTHVDFQHLAAGADAMTQLNLMVASKTLTDIIVGIDWKTVTGGATLWEEDGVIIDLTDLIPEYMPNYYAAIQEVPYWEPTLSIDGKMYYISDIQHGVIYQGPNIRGDWLEAAGLEKPATLDELYIWLSNLTTIEYIRNSLKRVRKKESSMILASQNLEDFVVDGIRELTRPLFAIPTHQFLFNAGSVNKKFYMDNLQLEPAEFELIRYPQRGVCLYKCGNERYLLEVHAPPYKEKLFGKAGGR